MGGSVFLGGSGWFSVKGETSQNHAGTSQNYPCVAGFQVVQRVSSFTDSLSASMLPNSCDKQMNRGKIYGLHFGYNPSKRK